LSGVSLLLQTSFELVKSAKSGAGKPPKIAGKGPNVRQRSANSRSLRISIQTYEDS
jgi:hypothetical protein